MTCAYLHARLTPGFAAPPQTELRPSPGDGLKGLPTGPIWF